MASRVSDLEGYRAIRLARGAGLVAARPGVVAVAEEGGPEVLLTPARARVWAERLASFADTAEAMARARLTARILGRDGGGRG